MPRHFRDQLRVFLSASGAAATRREAAAMVRNRRVALNGRVCTTGEHLVSPDDTVHLDGQLVPPPVSLAEARLWRYHKPAGIIVTHDDPLQRKTLFDALPDGLTQCRMLSVGRLDLASEGLMLLSSSRSLVRHLEQPASGFVRRYAVQLQLQGEPVADAILRELGSGITIKSGVRYDPISALRLQLPEAAEHTPAATLALNVKKSEKLLRQFGRRRSAIERDPDDVSFDHGRSHNRATAAIEDEVLSALGVDREGVSDDSTGAIGQSQWLHMALTQGKTNEVRRACAHFNLHVRRLIRLGFGPHALSGLAAGELDEVHVGDVELLRKSVRRSSPRE